MDSQNSTSDLVVAVNGVLIVLIGLPVSAYVGERMTSLWVPASVALIAVGLALQMPASTFMAYAVCAVVWTLGEMAFLPVVPTIVSGLAPTHLRGSYQGVYHAAWGLAKMIGPVLGGLVLAGASAGALWAGSAVLVGHRRARPAGAPFPRCVVGSARSSPSSRDGRPVLEDAGRCGARCF